MFKVKRIVTLLLCIALMGTLFIGCQNNENENENNNNQNTALNDNQNETNNDDEANDVNQDESDDEGDEEPMPISWLSFYPPQTDDSPVQQFMEEKFNIKITNFRIDRSNWDEQLNVRLAGGDIPDLFFMWDSGAMANYADQGIISEIPVSLIKEHMPVYSQNVDEINTSLWSGPLYDGKNYAIQLYWPKGQHGFQPAYNGTWMKKVGVDKAPETVDEFEELLRKFTFEDPDDNGEDDTFGLTARGKDGLFFSFSSVFGAYGTMPYNWNENEDGNLEYGMVTEKAKKALIKLNQWYEEGLIDPEFIVTDATIERQKFSGSQVGAIMGGDWGSYIDSGVWGTLMRENDLELVVGKPFEGPEGHSGGLAWGTQNNLIGMGANVEVGSDKMIKLLQILEQLHSDDNTYLTALLGIEGEHWEMENGLPQPFEEYVDVQTRGEKIGAGNYYTMFRTKSIPMLKYHYDQETLDFRDKVTEGVNFYINKLKFNYPSMNDYPDLTKIENEYFVSFIIGDVDVETEFEDFVDLWNESGGAVITEDINEVYAERK